MNLRRLAANVLHDVDIATRQQPHLTKPRSRHLKRRPHSLTVVNLHTRFDSTISKTEFALGFQSRRSVIARDAVRSGISLAQRCDHQCTVLEVSIYGSIGVVLE